MDALAERLPDSPALRPEAVARKRTLLSYYTAFVPNARRLRAFGNMCRGSTDGIFLQLGLACFKVPVVDRLRFCPECLAEMRAEHGELYWLRGHQLPSVHLCPLHAIPLRLSELVLSQQNRHAFIAATDQLCPLRAEALPTGTATDAEKLRDLAERSQQLLRQWHDSGDFHHWTQYYRQQLREHGYLKNRQVLQSTLHDDVGRYLGGMDSLLGIAHPGIDDSDNWLMALTRKHRKSIHPLFHLLLQQFLDRREHGTAWFGTGPWPCLNPLESHCGELRIQKVAQHRNRGHTVGVFACDCGYAYTRFRHSLHEPPSRSRPLRYGARFHDELARLRGEGASLRAIARRLHVDPKSVLYAERTGEGPARLPEQPAQAARAQRPRGSRPSRPWPEIDARLAREAVAAASKLRLREPPARITLAAIERELGRPHWIEKRAEHLPSAMSVLRRVTESTEHFQLRRVRWAVICLRSCHLPLKAWRIRRMAGLRSQGECTVEIAISKAVEQARSS